MALTVKLNKLDIIINNARRVKNKIQQALQGYCEEIQFRTMSDNTVDVVTTVALPWILIA